MHEARNSPHPRDSGDVRSQTPQLLLRLIAFVGIFCMSFAAHADDDEFAATCGRILDALRIEDWAAFKKECAEEIVFERIQRIYLQGFTANESRAVFGAPDWINNDTRNAPATQPGEANDSDVGVTHCVTMNNEPSKDESRAFHRFCEYVRDSYNRESAAIDWGKNVRGQEVKTLFGPAIEGKVASNFYWRVQLEEIGGHWRVRKLITEMH